MRAVRCHEYGPLDKLAVEDVPPAPLGAGQVRIAVHAAGVNFADMLMVQGQYQEKPPLPFTPGFELAGVVSEMGAGVTDLARGDRVMALPDNGGYADEAVCAATQVHRIPDSMDFVQAASFPVAYGTSHGAFDWRAHLKPGEWLLVHGAAGGVGLTAVEIGKAMGARVIATASSPEKLEVARRYGATHLIDYSREDIRARVREITEGHGADVVYDPVGGDAFDASLRSIAWGGRIIVIGFAAGRIPQIPANLVLVKNIDIIGFFWGSYRRHDPALVRQSFKTLLRWFDEGNLKPHISAVMDVAEVGRAFDMLKKRQSTGKIVLTTRR